MAQPVQYACLRPGRRQASALIREIRINAVAPGAIATPMVLNLPRAGQDMLMAPQPLHRFGTSEEVAEAVLWAHVGQVGVHLLALG